jgi:hypothetical protein
MTTLKILILCFLTLWISLPGMGGVALSHARHALSIMLVLHLQSHACCAPPMSCLFWTSNVMLVVHFQYHSLVLHFQCCVCFALATSCMFCNFNLMFVLHLQCCNCYAHSNVCFFYTCNVLLILQSLVSNFDIQQ